ncbi:type II secretion system protein [Paucibacter sp. APW11]|uniref:Type II secretion system protein n=1 Tax=Roseateles aquae TaxID=3077235 RepID=A0ABU3PG49_9BURK|nr:type II secretion system protein [Paucibacter sp. APW11]MDT9000916.1 type II secretion system protein [Paucibacter sp. APW11]
MSTLSRAVAWPGSSAAGAHRRQRGFTLIEMLVVLAMMGVLAAAARPMLLLSVQRSQEFALREALRTLRTGIDAYKRAAAEGQIAMSPQDSGYPPDLQSLVKGVPDAKSVNGRKLYFLRRLPRDPFADPALPVEESWGLRASDSPPDEMRAGRDVFDIYSTSERRALDGSRYKDW